MMLSETRGKLGGRKTAALLVVLAVLSHACGCDPTKQKGTETPAASADKSIEAVELTSVSDGKASPIGLIQGTSSSSALVGKKSEVAGIVTATFFDRGELGGFFLQEPTRNGDRSCGLFVAARVADLRIGDRIRVRGVVTEIDGMTALTPSKGARLEYEKLGADATVDPLLGVSAVMPSISVTTPRTRMRSPILRSATRA
ncbi:MAG: hypothetical protein AAFU85_29045, partial [Planctomycetota bacterium]